MSEGYAQTRFPRHSAGPVHDGRKSAVAGLILSAVMLSIPGLILSLISCRRCSRSIRNRPTRHARTTRLLGYIGLALGIVGLAMQIVVVLLFGTSIAQRVETYDAERAAVTSSGAVQSTSDGTGASSESLLTEGSAADTQRVGSAATGHLEIPAGWVEVDDGAVEGALTYADPQTASDDGSAAPYGYTSTVTLSSWNTSASALAQEFRYSLESDADNGIVTVSSIEAAGVTMTTVTCVNSATGIAEGVYIVDEADGCDCMEFRSLEGAMCETTSVLATYQTD